MGEIEKKKRSAKEKKLDLNDVKDLAQKQTNQEVSEIKDAKSGLEVSLKPKIRRWKLQARRVDGKKEMQEKIIKAKRLASELNLERPKLKKNKGWTQKGTYSTEPLFTKGCW